MESEYRTGSKLPRFKSTMDRNKAGHKSMVQCSDHNSSMFTLPQPLAIDLTNRNLSIDDFNDTGTALLPSSITRMVTKKKTKLRLPTNLRDIASLQGPESTAAPGIVIPAKSSSFPAKKQSVQFKRKLSRGASATIVIPDITGSDSDAPLNKEESDSKKLTGEANSRTTDPQKTTHKRIPAYDYKARFYVLLEKYQVLKEVVRTEYLTNEQLEKTLAELSKKKKELLCAQTGIESLQQQNELQRRKMSALTENYVKRIQEHEDLKTEYSLALTERDELRIQVEELRKCNASLIDNNCCLADEIIAGRENLYLANIERAALHNTLMELRGNIRVICRVRPPLSTEKNKQLCDWQFIDDTTLEVHQPNQIEKSKAGTFTFSFDHIFQSSSTQEDVFELVAPLIQSALDGYNSCILAYGQTGSGKTYTMDGTSSDMGVIPRTVDLLFDSILKYRGSGWKYKIKATFLEIYNEMLFDLLSKEPKQLDIRMCKHNKNEVYVSNIQEEIVCTAARLKQLMEVARINRNTAATLTNERSSRSHAVTKLEVIGTHVEKKETSIGSINLVDLAGSESPKTSRCMNETKNINRSLSELTNVVIALLEKHEYIPYRNSKLTHLLMPALGGNSKTLLFLNISPLEECFVESTNSLRFGSAANSCKWAKVKRNRFFTTMEK